MLNICSFKILSSQILFIQHPKYLFSSKSFLRIIRECKQRIVRFMDAPMQNEPIFHRETHACTNAYTDVQRRIARAQNREMRGRFPRVRYSHRVTDWFDYRY